MGVVERLPFGDGEPHGTRYQTGAMQLCSARARTVTRETVPVEAREIKDAHIGHNSIKRLIIAYSPLKTSTKSNKRLDPPCQIQHDLLPRFALLIHLRAIGNGGRIHPLQF